MTASRFGLILVGLLVQNNLLATIWPVGQGKTYETPSQVANLVAKGDTVSIDAGEYVGDVAFWKADQLLLTCPNGQAHLNANGNSAGQKAIWVIQGDDITVEHIEFSHCTVPDKNGAGIRQEGTNLTVRHCHFHDNENGILAGNDANSTILVEYSEFGSNGYGDGYSHNIYVNHVARFIFRYNYSHDSQIGHLVKSRAHQNFILYNRLDSGPGSGVSYEVDLPNGGLSFLIGNQIDQPQDGANSALVSYGQEGLSNPGPHQFYAINNTMVNRKTVGRFFSLNGSAQLFKAWNNLLAGGGDMTSEAALVMDTVRNFLFTDPLDAGFVDVLNGDVHLLSGSPAIDQGLDPEFADTIPLYPAEQYVHPASREGRPQNGLLDIGAYEGPLINATDQEDAGPDIRLWRTGSMLGSQGLQAGDVIECWSLTGQCLMRTNVLQPVIPVQPFVVVIYRHQARMMARLVP